MMYALKNAKPEFPFVKAPGLVVWGESTTETLIVNKCQKCGRTFEKGLTMHMRFCKG